MSQADNVDWINTDTDIAALYHSAAEDRGTYKANVGRTKPGTVAIQSNFPEIAAAFSMAFPETDIDTAQRGFFHLEQMPKGILGWIDDMLYRTHKPAIALQNPETKDVLVIEKAAFNYGFVNAMVLGFLSKLHMDTQNGLYAHAASLSVNEVGVLIAGDHKAGKSTLISKILSVAEENDSLELGIVSDDWVLLDDHEGTLVSSRLSEEFRIDRKTITDPCFGVSATFNAMVTPELIDQTAKVQIPLGDICLAMKFNDLQSCRQNKIVILDPVQDSFIKDVDPERALAILSASSANVPPLSPQEQEAFRTFWLKQFSTYETTAINNRYPSAPLETVANAVISLAKR